MRTNRRWWILSLSFMRGQAKLDNLSTYHYLLPTKKGEAEKTACGIELPKGGAYAKLVAAPEFPTKRCEKCLEATKPKRKK